MFSLFSRFISPYANIIFTVLLVIAAGTAKYYQWQANRYEAKANHAVRALDQLVVDSARIAAEDEARHQDALNLSMQMLAQAEKQYKRDKNILLDQVKKGAEHNEALTSSLNDERNFSRVLQDRLRASQAEREALAKQTEYLGEGGECNAVIRRQIAEERRHYIILEEACTLTTMEFNLCRGWMDEACTLFTCGEE